MELILTVAGFVLIIFGIAEAVRRITFACFREKTDDTYFLLVSPKSADSCELCVRQAAEKLRWMDLKSPCGLICMNPEEDAEIQAICEKLKTRYSNLTVSNFADLRYNMEQEEARA